MFGPASDGTKLHKKARAWGHGPVFGVVQLVKSL